MDAVTAPTPMARSALFVIPMTTAAVPAANRKEPSPDTIAGTTIATMTEPDRAVQNFSSLLFHPALAMMITPEIRVM